jgi:hypothetical protein
LGGGFELGENGCGGSGRIRFFPALPAHPFGKLFLERHEIQRMKWPRGLLAVAVRLEDERGQQAGSEVKPELLFLPALL